MTRRGEFDFIRTRLVPLTRGHEAALGLSDDAALFAPPADTELVLATDMLVAGVHFLAGDTPQVAAWRCLRSNISDMAAMGARPLGYLAAIGWPEHLPETWREDFIRALGEDQTHFGLALWGGDTTSTPGPLTVALTLIGSVPRGQALRRSGAQAGDGLWVSGTIGDAVLGLDLASGKSDPGNYLLQRYRRPEPRVALGEALRGAASACIDISDGLVADAGHLSACSGVALDIEASRIPLSREAAQWCAAQDEAGLMRLITGGDDYELLFTAPRARDADIAALAGRLELRLTRIGEVKAGRRVQVLDADGGVLDIERAGFTHF